MSRAAAITFAGLGAAAALACGPARAGAWSAGAEASVLAQYDDNVRFTPTAHVADQLVYGSFAARLGWGNGASSFLLRPSADGYWYRNYQAYNRTDGALAASGRWQGERSRIDASLEGTIDSTLTSEFGFTGYSDANKRREALSATIAPRLQLTERLTVLASASWSRSRYIDAQLTPLVDYSYGSGMVGLERQLSPLASLSVQVTAGRLRVPGRPLYDKDSWQAVLDWQRQLGQRWSIELSAGPSRVRNTLLHVDDNGAVYSAALSRGGEVGRVTLGATRTISPNGVGALVRRDVLTLSGDRPLGERLSFNWSANWSRINEARTAGVSASPRLNYLDAGFGLAWKPAPTWSLELGARRYQQSYGTQVVTAGKTQAQLRATWTGLQHGAG